jgi:hypothetical protein
VLQVFLQLTILLTGNYNFFNLLTAALCLTLLEPVVPVADGVTTTDPDTSSHALGACKALHTPHTRRSAACSRGCQSTLLCGWGLACVFVDRHLRQRAAPQARAATLVHRCGGATYCRRQCALRAAHVRVHTRWHRCRRR